MSLRVDAAASEALPEEAYEQPGVYSVTLTVRDEYGLTGTTTIACGLAAVLGMLALNGLPMPYHPVFNVPRFTLASHDRFFLCIEASDPRFDREDTRRFIDGLAPRTVSEVEF